MTATATFSEQFMSALQTFERDGDTDRFVELFTDDAELQSLTEHEPLRGHDGARAFWDGYRSAFGEIRSKFDRVIQGDRTVVLEWHSDGTLADGQPISYRGVSILELSEDRVQRFRTYYDSAPFASRQSRQAAAKPR